MEMAQKRYELWCSQVQDPELAAELAGLAGNNEEIFERFYRDLEFGTGGLRGVLGAGTNRMNIYTVRRATQGLADYLNSTDLPKTVAIGYDSRIKSDVFAKETARVMAANGIIAHLYPRLEPTPALSWAVRALGTGTGVCVTASHNPAKYNGYKAYGPDGCQIGLEVADAVLENITKLDVFADVKVADFDEALAAGTIKYIPEEVLDAFLDAVYAQRVGDGAGADKLKLVYTPLNGSGLECVTRMLAKMGIENVTIVPEQQYPDGKGGYRLITGNELGIILLDYICRMRIAQGTMPKDPIAVTTIVSTDMVDAIAAKYGVELRRVLTGFKFIGEQIADVENQGHPERYIFGFEESYGYLSSGHVRDKDAVNASMLACECAAWYAGQGKTLLDAIEDLYKEYGYYQNGLCSFTFEGASGMETMKNLMENLRKAPPAEIAGMKVVKAVDYKAEGTGLPKANVLEYRLEGGAKFMVRPSGTEPKIKTYLSAVGKTEAEATAINARMAEAAKEMMKG